MVRGPAAGPRPTALTFADNMKTIIATVISVFLWMTGIAIGQETNASCESLTQWTGKTIQQMIRELGSPTNELSYTIGSAPTKGWIHGILFSIYPQKDPNNKNIAIKEFVWDQGQFVVRACCHLVKKAWLVMGAVRMDKRVRF